MPIPVHLRRPQRNENCSEVRPGQKKRTTTAGYRKRKECHSQRHPPPTRASLARKRERPHTLRFGLPSPLLGLTLPSPEKRICRSKLDSPAVAVVTAPGPSSTWGWVGKISSAHRLKKAASGTPAAPLPSFSWCGRVSLCWTSKIKRYKTMPQENDSRAISPRSMSRRKQLKEAWRAGVQKS